MPSPLFKRHLQLVRLVRMPKGIRDAGLFPAEGSKLVRSMLKHGHHPELLFHTESFDVAGIIAGQCVAVSTDEMGRLSALPSSPDVLALFRLPQCEPLPLRGHRTVMLDDVQDPANVGTLIRTASWFGVHQVICSPSSALAYAPKAVQASMGAIASMHVAYAELAPILRGESGSDLPIVAAVLGGDMAWGEPPSEWVLLLGNEGHGLSPALEAMATRRITIAAVGDPSVDSLNVAAAGAVMCAWLAHGL